MLALLVLMEAHTSTAGQNSLTHTGCERHEIVKSRGAPLHVPVSRVPLLADSITRFATEEAHRSFRSTSPSWSGPDRLNMPAEPRLLPLHFLASIGNDLWQRLEILVGMPSVAKDPAERALATL